MRTRNYSPLIVKLITIILCITFFSTTSKAGDDHHRKYPQHIVGVFLGGTDEDSGATEFTIGGEYELRFHKYFGVGGIVERAPNGHSDHGATTAMGALYLHPAGGLRVTGGIGIESVDGYKDKTLYRLGASYDFEITKSIAIAPTVNVDFVDDKKNIVFGMVFLKHF